MCSQLELFETRLVDERLTPSSLSTTFAMASRHARTSSASASLRISALAAWLCLAATDRFGSLLTSFDDKKDVLCRKSLS